MMKRILVNGLGTSLIQIIIFCMVILIVYWFAAALNIPSSNDPNGDYTVLFMAIFFSILVFAKNLIAAVINNTKATHAITVIAIALYAYSLFDVGSIPFKSWLCLVFGILILSMKKKIDSMLMD